ncbi:hypothetical protein N2152v2_011040 [Parachlorella kessleri]
MTTTQLGMEYRSPTTALDAIGFGRFHFLLLLYAGLAYFADACETMLLSFLGPSARCQWGLSPSAESALTSVVFAGMLVGVYSLGALADSLGRRRGFLASALLLGVSGLASALAPSFGWLLVGRAVVGLALGGTPIIITLYVEFMPSAQRGRWSLMLHFFWTLGTMFEAVLAWAVLPPLGWRWLLALSASPLLLLLLLYPLLPESPHWLVVQGRYAEAEAVVLRVARVNLHSRQMRLCFGVEQQQQQQQFHEEIPWQSRAKGAEEEVQLRAGQLGVAGSGSRGHPASAVGPHPVGFVVGSVSGGESPLESPREAPQAGAAAAEWLREQQAAAGRHQQQSVRRSRRRHLAPANPHSAGSEQTAAGEDGSWRYPVGMQAARGRLDWFVGEARQLLQEMRGAFGQLYGPRLRQTTLLLYVIWFVNAITYYGLVLLTTALQSASKEQECTEDGKANLQASDYTAVLITSLAEAPGLLAAACLVDWLGRKWTLHSLLLCCACCALLLGLSGGGGGRQLLLLFIARAGIEGSFCVLYVYTPEVYPTAVRAFGLSLCNAFSRIGGFLAPFATVYLVESKDPQASEVLLGTLCLGAMLAACFLPLETTGVDLHEHDEDGLPDPRTLASSKPLRVGAAQDATSGGDNFQEQQQHLELNLPASPEGFGVATGGAAARGRGSDEAPLLHG